MLFIIFLLLQDICRTEVEWNVKGVFVKFARFCSQDRNCSGNLDVQSCLASGAIHCSQCRLPTCAAGIHFYLIVLKYSARSID